jgi:hypothetical protein
MTNRYFQADPSFLKPILQRLNDIILLSSSSEVRWSITCQGSPACEILRRQFSQESPAEYVDFTRSNPSVGARLCTALRTRIRCDRTSTHWLASNQVRLWFSAFAHLIMSSLQAEVLKGTELESASIGQIRLRLFNIAAQLKASVRRIHVERCSAYPLQALFGLVHQRLSALRKPALLSAQIGAGNCGLTKSESGARFCL